MYKPFLVTAGILGALAVGLGAFGAHALKDVLTPSSINTYETAVRYHFYQVFALAITGILAKNYPDKFILYAGRFFIGGVIIFSGSLYLLSFLTAAGMEGFRWLGAITPVGGLLFIAGWLSLTLGVIRSDRK